MHIYEDIDFYEKLNLLVRLPTGIDILISGLWLFVVNCLP